MQYLHCAGVSSAGMIDSRLKTELANSLGDEQNVNGGWINLVEEGQRRDARVRRMDAAVELQGGIAAEAQ